MTAKFCNVIGTGVKGSGTEMWAQAATKPVAVIARRILTVRDFWDFWRDSRIDAESCGSPGWAWTADGMWQILSR
jgi:hypothetical protein